MLRMLALAVAGLWLVGCCAEEAAPAYRLPVDVQPETYRLELLTDLDPVSNFSFVGLVKIKIQALNPTSEIKLHQKDLNIKNKQITVKSENGQKSIPVKSVEASPEYDLLVITLEEALEGNKYYVLNIPFDGKLKRNLNGYYRSSYDNKATGKTEWLAVTQFEPTYARQAFPCFDEPAMKANFTIVLGHHKEFTAASNMPIKSTKPVSGVDSWQWDEFEESVRMSTYLVAYMVSKFKFLESDATLSTTKFKIWAPSHLIDQAKLAGDVGPKVLTFYEDFFNVPFPLPKQDMVAIPDFAAGAMENWGFITYRETALLYDEKSGSIYNKERVSEVIAHELAHQWFGNLVTMKWWSDLWLNEGFATYVAAVGMNHVYPEWKMLEYEAVSNFQLVLILDQLESSHPISVPIGDPKEIKQIFDTISYKKGAIVIRMMNKFLGSDVFRTGLHNYLVKHQYGNAEQDDLWSALTEEAHKQHALEDDISVKDIMDTWTKQTGYPILTVTRAYDKGQVHVSQERYLSIKKPSDEDHTSKREQANKWWVPLSFVTKKTTQKDEAALPKDWLSPASKDGNMYKEPADSHDSWLLLNEDLIALYRVNYDQQNWDLLIKTLLNPDEYKQIPTLNRVQILFDTMAFAKSGLLNYSTPLRMLEYLDHEDEHLPLKAALAGLDHISGLLARTSDYGVFEKFARKILAPQYKKTKEEYDSRDPNDNEVIKKHITVNGWACKVRVPECEENAINLFDEWMSEPDQPNPIPSELRTQTYCMAIARGSVAHWEFLWSRYQSETSASQKISILQGLACTRIIWLNKRYIEWTLRDGPEIRRQDASSVYQSIATSDTGYYVAKTFLYSRIKDIYDTVPDKDRIGSYVSVIGNQAIDKDEYEEFLKFVKDNEQYMEGSKLKIDQTLENSEINQKWRKDNLEYVVGLLKEMSS